MPENVQYSVQPGDCLSSIAQQFGVPWRKIWDFSDNSALKQKRKNPNILYEGDVLVIPLKEEGNESASSDRKHTYKVSSELTRLRVKLLNEDDPRANQKFILQFDTGKIIESTTDRSGMLNVPLEASAKRALLKLQEPDGWDEYELSIGALDPVDLLSGVQGRLRNLGFEPGPIDGLIGPLTRGAVREFQFRHSLQVDGIPGPITQAKLKETHGS